MSLFSLTSAPHLSGGILVSSQVFLKSLAQVSVLSVPHNHQINLPVAFSSHAPVWCGGFLQALPSPQELLLPQWCQSLSKTTNTYPGCPVTIETIATHVVFVAHGDHSKKFCTCSLVYSTFPSHESDMSLQKFWNIPGNDLIFS